MPEGAGPEPGASPAADERSPRARATQPAGRLPQLVIAGFTFRRVVRGALLWGIVFGLFIYINSAGIAATYPTPESRQLFAQTLGANPGLHALYGEPKDIETFAGYVSWRSSTGFALIGGIWAILTATRLLRGEEEAGRWELLLAGRATRRRGTAGVLAGLGAGLVVLYIGIAVISMVSGMAQQEGWSAAQGLYLALAATGGASISMAVAALASQLLPTRRAAITWAAGALGAMFLIRALADTVNSLGWLRWVTPLGWIEILHPVVGGQPGALIPWAALIVILSFLTIILAGKRDLDSGFLPSRDTAPAHTRLLGGHLGLNIRLNQLTLLGWLLGIGVWGALFGSVIKTAAEALNESSAFTGFLGNLGAQNRAVESFFGFIFLFIAIVMAIYAASQASATREEEAQGYVDNLLARPVSRYRWLAGRVAVSVAGIVVLGLGAGLFTWVAAYWQDTGVGFNRMIEAGLNPVAPAIFILGLGTLVHGLAPRLVSTIAYGVIAWSFLVEMLGSVISSRLVVDLSVFHYMALVPAADIRWDSTVGFLGLGLGAALLGGAFFNRRDLAGQ